MAKKIFVATKENFKLTKSFSTTTSTGTHFIFTVTELFFAHRLYRCQQCFLSECTFQGT